MNTLKAEKRELSTKAKKLRREGYVTGNVFGREMKESLPIKLNKFDVDKILKDNGKGSQVMLEVDGQTYDALIKEIDFNALKHEVIEIDFQALVSNEKVHSVAEIFLLNHENRGGGLVQQILHEVEFKALPAALVDKIELDVGNLKLGDSIKVKDLAIASNPDIELKTDPESTIVVVTEVKNKEEDTAADDTEAEEAAETTK